MPLKNHIDDVHRKPRGCIATFFIQLVSAYNSLDTFRG